MDSRIGNSLLSLPAQNHREHGNSHSPVVVSAQPADLLELSDVARLIAWLWKHKLRIIFWLLVTLGLFAAYIKEAVPVYQSDAQIIVTKRHPITVDGQSPIPISSEAVSAYLALLSSSALAERVLQKGESADLETFKNMSLTGSPADWARRLASKIKVSHKNQQDGPYVPSNVFEISFSGEIQEDCPAVLALVLDEFQSYLSDQSSSTYKEALVLVNESAEQVKSQLARQESEYLELNANLAQAHERRSHSDRIAQKLDQIHERRMALLTECASQQFRLEALKKLSREGKNTESVRTMLSPEYLEKEMNPLDEHLLPLIVRQKKLVQQVGPMHPSVSALEKEIGVVRQQYAKYAGNSLEHVRDPLQLEILSAEQKYQELCSAEKALRDEYQSVMEESEAKIAATAEVAQLEQRQEQMRTAITREQAYYDALLVQAHDIRLAMASSDIQTTVTEPPSFPVQTEPRWLFLLAMAVSLGILIGLAHACAVEISELKFQSSSEVVQSLHLPMLAKIPFLKGRGSKRTPKKVPGMKTQEPILLSHFTAESKAAEAYRFLRTNLNFQTIAASNGIIQIASPYPGDGKTTVSVNLAIALALAGKKTLLLEADLRTPRFHEIFDIEGDAGTAELLAGNCNLDAAIRPGPVDLMSILPCGKLPSNPADLLAMKGLDDLFSTLRRQFDFVVVDTPALLIAVDSQILAYSVDGIILTVRSTRQDCKDALSVIDQLRTTGTSILGVALNGVVENGKAMGPANLHIR